MTIIPKTIHKFDPQTPGSEPERPVILAMSSHVARGSVGNRAVVFALETLGHQVWSVPTVTLPWHPGHGPATRIVPDDTSFEAFCEDIAAAPHSSEIAAVITGYFGSEKQIEIASRLITRLRDERPSLTYCLDPVLGDGGRLYRPRETLHAMRDRLLPLADIATPNRYELEFLTELSLTDNNHLVDAARTLGPETVVVTSAFGMLKGSIANLLVTSEATHLAEHRLIPGAPNGGGDLTAALLLARLLEGLRPEKALQLATASVFDMMARTTKRGADEMTLVADAEVFRQPLAMVQTRRLERPRKL
ncbi:MAG: pyridoxal kinase [Fulvimarina manganoxydans]|uniref:pyridoxal kinase n=1 Tax=Fulvimarina manganoxydans TaxID=937218 RepID=UPI0023536A9C|nr:pyridoxal kinase [Fulvimarina manganoxydans]MCK5931946.1 pyridoxal kinase [Fulvimarina manganoxydans]